MWQRRIVPPNVVYGAPLSASGRVQVSSSLPSLKASSDAGRLVVICHGAVRLATGHSEVGYWFRPYIGWIDQRWPPG